MKLLLTSAGVTTNEIRNTLEIILGKPLLEATVFFVPTAINQFKDRKQRISEYRNQLSGLVEKMYTVDIANELKDKWIKELDKSDLIYVSGGNPYYLLYWIKKSGLADIFPEALKTKTYLGISAGSMIMGNQIPIEPKDFSIKYLDKKNPNKALGFFSANIVPHFGAKEHPDISNKDLKKLAKTYPNIYALGDKSALLIKGNEITIINKVGVKHYE